MVLKGHQKGKALRHVGVSHPKQHTPWDPRLRLGPRGLGPAICRLKTEFDLQFGTYWQTQPFVGPGRKHNAKTPCGGHIGLDGSVFVLGYPLFGGLTGNQKNPHPFWGIQPYNNPFKHGFLLLTKKSHVFVLLWRNHWKLLLPFESVFFSRIPQTVVVLSGSLDFLPPSLPGRKKQQRNGYLQKTQTHIYCVTWIRTVLCSCMSVWAPRHLSM